MDEAETAFCSARAGGDGLKWRDAFRPDTISGPWSEHHGTASLAIKV